MSNRSFMISLNKQIKEYCQPRLETSTQYIVAEELLSVLAKNLNGLEKAFLRERFNGVDKFNQHVYKIFSKMHNKVWKEKMQNMETPIQDAIFRFTIDALIKEALESGDIM